MTTTHNTIRKWPPAAEIIRRLGGNLTSGMCKCPSHNDADPSLHVSDGHRGVVFKCHGGCTQEAVINALQSRGLGPRETTATYDSKLATKDAVDDDPDKSWRRARAIWFVANNAKAAGKPEAYLKGRGIDIVPNNAILLPTAATRVLRDDNAIAHAGYPAMVFEIVGTKLPAVHVTSLSRSGETKLAVDNPKRTYGSVKGGYIWLGGDADPDDLDKLVVAEGIENALSVMQITGIPAIAAISASNMAAVNLPRCRELIIAADNDAPGRKGANALAERIEYEGGRAQIALPPKGSDWNDVLRGGDALGQWEKALAAPAPTDSTAISALEESDFMQLAFPQRELFLEPWLPHPGLVMIHAPRGEGKTYLALAVGKAVASGFDLMDWQCPNGPARVLYVDGELPGAALQERLDRFARSPTSMFHVLCRDTFLLRRQLMPDLGEPEGRQELDRIIRLCRPDLIVLDSLSTLVRSGVENEAESWAPIQEWLMKHRWQGRTVLLLHHAGRSNKPRGTSKREDVMDTMIGLAKNDEDSTPDESVFDLTFTKTRDFFGDDAAPLRLHFSVQEGQKVSWRSERFQDLRREKVRELLEEGWTHAEIGKEIGVGRSRVTQIASELKNNENTREEG